MTHEELVVKAKNAASVEEILQLAKENEVEITPECAQAYFAHLHRTGALNDEELDNVSGGGCHHEGKLVVSALNYCDDWICERCGKHQHNTIHGHRCDRETSQEKSNIFACCSSCKYCIYEDGLWLCTHR